MTIQDLFRHTAGFSYGEFSNVPEIKAAYQEAKLFTPGITAESRTITPDQFVTAIAKAPLVHEPGTTWEYSMAVDVLGRVVEAISGERLHRRERQSEPTLLTPRLLTERRAQFISRLCHDPPESTSPR